MVGAAPSAPSIRHSGAKKVAKPATSERLYLFPGPRDSLSSCGWAIQPGVILCAAPQPLVWWLPSRPDRRNHGGMSAPETLTLRATAIAGQRYADDYAVIWRGMSVGRIMLGNGAPHDRPQWIWSCHVHGRPQGGDDRGNAANLVDAKARFKNAWTRIRASLTDQDIADAQQIAALTAEALARLDRRYGR